jgi:cell division transport system ATP-binding protein
MSIDNIISFEAANIFQEDHLVLSDVNFEIKKNEFVYLIGKVGSGKTSLIKNHQCRNTFKTRNCLRGRV